MSASACDAGAAIDRDHAALRHAPAEQRNPHQLALEDEGEVVEQREQRERLPGRLVLGGDHERPLQPPAGRCSRPRISTLVPQTTRSSHTLVRPHSSAIFSTARRGSSKRQQRHHQQHAQIQIEQHVEEDGPDDDHDGSRSAFQKGFAGSGDGLGKHASGSGRRYTSDIRKRGAAPSRIVPPVLDADPIRHHRIGHQGHAGKLVRELGHRARHVEVRGDDDQRLEAALRRPSAASRSRCRSCWSPSGRDRRSRRTSADAPAQAGDFGGSRRRD